MPVLVDCRKRDASIFLDDPFSDPPFLSKRIRRSETASFQLSPPPPSPSASTVSHGGGGYATTPPGLLNARFADLDNKLVKRVLEASGSNSDFAIKSLNELQPGSQVLHSASSISSMPIVPNVPLPSEGCVVGSSGGPATICNLPADGSGWVELLLRELTTASDMDDAKARASRVLELLQKSILARARAEATESLGKASFLQYSHILFGSYQENKMLKDQVEALIRDNSILKRAVAIQHERQKTCDAQNEELQHLKQMLAQYKEQLRTLEFNNYMLAMQLKEAQQNSPIPGRFHPDVF